MLCAGALLTNTGGSSNEKWAIIDNATEWLDSKLRFLSTQTYNSNGPPFVATYLAGSSWSTRPGVFSRKELRPLDMYAHVS